MFGSPFVGADEGDVGFGDLELGSQYDQLFLSSISDLFDLFVRQFHVLLL
jgi:hypothetical protein